MVDINKLSVMLKNNQYYIVENITKDLVEEVEGPFWKKFDAQHRLSDLRNGNCKPINNRPSWE